MKVRILFWSILGGIALTLLSGLVSNTPPMWLGATLYGYPLAWLIKRILAPEYFPWSIDPANLVVDLLIWTGVIGVVLFITTKIKR